MPVNERYPLADVLAECRRYVELRRRKVFVEYVMLAGVNDRVEQARQLAGAAQAAGRVQGEPDPVQPDRRRVHRLVARRDRRVRRDAPPRRRAGDDPPDARAATSRPRAASSRRRRACDPRRPRLLALGAAQVAVAPRERGVLLDELSCADALRRWPTSCSSRSGSD